MKDAQKPDHVSLNTLIGYLKDGRYVIPDFQREFEWYPWDIRELMRSIFLDYYIGSLLLWKGNTENFDALSCEPVYGFDGKSDRREYIVLDGQQRLTAMYYAFLAPKVKLPSRASRGFYFLQVDRFMAEEYDQAFNYEFWTKRWTKILENPEAQYADHVFPLFVVGRPVGLSRTGCRVTKPTGRRGQARPRSMVTLHLQRALPVTRAMHRTSASTSRASLSSIRSLT